MDEQLERLMERIAGILESHPAAIYLPCFYRSTPPRIFLTQDSVRVLIRGRKILHYEVEPFDLEESGYEEMDSGRYEIAYEFLPGKRFRLELEGTMMEKTLQPGGLMEEVYEIRERLGIYDVVPLLGMQRLESAGEDGVPLRIRKLDPEVSVPSYAHPGDAGLDICSAEDVYLEPGRRALVSTGFAMALP